MTVLNGFTAIQIPSPPGPNVYITVTGNDAAGDIVGNYGYVDGDGDQNFEGFADTGGGAFPFNPPTSSNNLSIKGCRANSEIKVVRTHPRLNKASMVSQILGNA